jgi:hypothetical protein
VLCWHLGGAPLSFVVRRLVEMHAIQAPAVCRLETHDPSASEMAKGADVLPALRPHGQAPWYPQPEVARSAKPDLASYG